MPLPNFVHVDTVSKHQLAITANYIGVCTEQTTETRKRCMHVTWQVQFIRAYVPVTMCPRYFFTQVQLFEL